MKSGDDLPLTVIFSCHIMNVMNKKQKEEWFKLFAEAFHEVVIPILETLATKDDLNEVKERLGGVENRLEKVEYRLDKIDDRLDRHGKILDKHENRISELEVASV